MIEVWSWPTPNGHKVHIALEELGLEYKVIPVNIGAGDQFKPEFLKITANHRIPAIVDSDGPGGKPFTLFESAAILIYLSEKTGGKLIPKLLGVPPQCRNTPLFPFLPRALRREAQFRFARDSPLEEGGFELSVPARSAAACSLVQRKKSCS
jgi:glutathione S-transferase